MKWFFYTAYMFESTTFFRNPSIVLELRLSKRFDLTILIYVYCSALLVEVSLFFSFFYILQIMNLIKTFLLEVAIKLSLFSTTDIHSWFTWDISMASHKRFNPAFTRFRSTQKWIPYQHIHFFFFFSKHNYYIFLKLIRYL